MRVIIYRVLLLEPTLVPALDGDPNSATALDFLPGSVLRGAVMRRYIHRERSKNPTYQFDAAEDKTRRLFFNGVTRYLNGYRLDRTDKRTLPTPMSWKHRKGEETLIQDFALESPDLDDTEQWQNVNSPFCSITDDFMEDDDQLCITRLITPDHHISVHTTRTPRFGRGMPRNRIKPDENPGAIYRYDALAEGQEFEAIILCDHDDDADDVKPLLTGEATLGGSRSAGYGRVRFANVDDGPANWHEAGGLLTNKADSQLIVTLLSDALIRDHNGQFVVDKDVVKTTLEKRIGCKLSTPQAFMRGRFVGGFNRKWGLPLPQALAIQMGSVFIFDSVCCDENKLRELEVQGIGECRSEGFGRVAVNWHTEEKLAVEDPKVGTGKIGHPIKVITLLPQSEELAKRMAKRLFHQRLDVLVVSSANAIDVNNPPKNSQLSRLRSIIHDELMKETPSLRRISDFLNDVKSRSTVSRQFNQARVRNMTLLEWLDKTCQITSDSDWKSLFHFRSEDMRKVGGVRIELTDVLRAQYVLLLIDGVLARASKQREG